MSKKLLKIPQITKDLDRKLKAAAQGVSFLNALNWDEGVHKNFLKSWRAGKAELPEVQYRKYDFRNKKSDLRDIQRKCDKKDPLQQIIAQTAQSCESSLRMIESQGKPLFYELSELLFGLPTDRIGKSKQSSKTAAKRILREISKYNRASLVDDAEYCVLPSKVASQIRAAAKKFIPGEPIRAIVDPNLTPKASAKKNEIRVRGSTCFTELDIKYFIEHELLVHSLTLQNAAKQPLHIFGLVSPRITLAQEGLAVFAEFITNSMSLHRLRRICARTIAIYMGASGANFLEVFEFFLEQGQSEEESYFSAARVFRGGDVGGGIVFTKDCVYFRGLLEVHTFFLSSLRDKHFMYPNYFLSGRYTIKDVERLAPYFEAGTLKQPTYRPPWLEHRSALLAFLLSSKVMHSLGID